MDAAKLVGIGQALLTMAPALGSELVRVGGEMQGGRVGPNEASKQLYKAIDREIKRVRAYDVTGHFAAQVQQLAHVRTEIAQGVLKENWNESFPKFKEMWQSAQKETAIPRWLARIESWVSSDKKVKLACRIAASSIGAFAFAGKLMTNADARRKAGQVLRQTTEVAKGYSIQFCETARAAVAKTALKVRTTAVVVAHKVATGIRSAAKTAGSFFASVRSKIASWF